MGQTDAFASPAEIIRRWRVPRCVFAGHLLLPAANRRPRCPAEVTHMAPRGPTIADYMARVILSSG